MVDAAAFTPSPRPVPGVGRLSRVRLGGAVVLSQAVLHGLFAFAVIRRGELLLHDLGALVLLRPISLLFLRPVSLTGPRTIRAHEGCTTVVLRDLWLGGGARCLRGPPVLVS